MGPSKLCSRCGLKQQAENFNFRNKTKGLLQAWCKTCHKEYAKRPEMVACRKNWWLNVRSATLTGTVAKSKMVKVRELVLEAKNRPCADCFRVFPDECMDFDHVRGVKTYELAKMHTKAYSLETVRHEIAKCEVVCANCHRIRTKARRTTP